MAEPRKGHRTTLVLEAVDEDGLALSDVTFNWYGGAGREGRNLHNNIQVSLGEAIVAAVKEWKDSKQR